MAKKKKSELQDVGAQVDKLIKEVGDDREVLVKFLEDLITQYSGEKAVGIAEYVAKLADALTRQHQVKANVVKALAKASSADDEEADLNEIQSEIGLPFKVEVDDGAN